MQEKNRCSYRHMSLANFIKKNCSNNQNMSRGGHAKPLPLLHAFFQNLTFSPNFLYFFNVCPLLKNFARFVTIILVIVQFEWNVNFGEPPTLWKWQWQYYNYLRCPYLTYLSSIPSEGLTLSMNYWHLCKGLGEDVIVSFFYKMWEFA